MVDIERLHLRPVQRKPAGKDLCGRFRLAVCKQFHGGRTVPDHDGGDLEGDVAVQSGPVQAEVDPGHRPHQRDTDLGFAAGHEPVRPSAHRHAPAVFIGVSHVEAVGFRLFARERLQRVAEIGRDENVVGRLRQQGRPEPDGAVRRVQFPGSPVSALFQETFGIVDEQIDVGDKLFVGQGRPGRDPASYHIQDEHGLCVPVVPVPT